jgi:hypothetical protein
MSKNKKDDMKQKETAKTKSKAKPVAKPVVVKAGKKTEAKAVKAANTTSAVKKSSKTGVIQGVGAKIPRPNDVKEINKKLAVAMKPAKSSLRKFGTAESAYSPDKEVVTSTRRGPVSVKATKKK